MTLHKHLQEVFAAVKEMLEVADAISGMRTRDEDGDSTYPSFPFPTSSDRHCGDLLDDVVAPLPMGRRNWTAEPKLLKWEQAVSSDDRRVVKLLFADYREKKLKLTTLLSRELEGK